MNQPILPVFKDTESPSVITEFALQLLASNQCGQNLASGTAMIVAPHLAITAKHVIDDFAKRFDDLEVQGGEHLQMSLEALQLVGNKLAVWEVTRVWLSRIADVAFLRLTPKCPTSGEYEWRAPHIDITLPPLGSKIRAFGYPGTKAEVCEGGKQSVVQVLTRPKTATGEVLEHHPEKRDNFTLPFPCFRTNARFDGGMSGGPVINEDGNLCGIVCNNMPPYEPDGEHCSYVSLLWPALLTPIDLDRTGYPSGQYYPVYELDAGGFIKVVGIDKLKIHKGGAAYTV